MESRASPPAQLGVCLSFVRISASDVSLIVNHDRQSVNVYG